MTEGNPVQRYLVRDPQGHVYGPADSDLLRQWVADGRIVAGMDIAPQETREWLEASQHPAVADLIQARLDREHASVDIPAAATNATTSVTHVTGSATPAPTTWGGDTRDVVPTITPRQNPLGLMSFIFSLSGIVVNCAFCVPMGGCISIPFALLLHITAVTLACIALVQINRAPELFLGRGLAIAGLSVGGVMLCLYSLGLLIGLLIMWNAPP